MENLRQQRQINVILEFCNQAFFDQLVKNENHATIIDNN